MRTRTANIKSSNKNKGPFRPFVLRHKATSNPLLGSIAQYHKYLLLFTTTYNTPHQA